MLAMPTFPMKTWGCWPCQAVVSCSTGDAQRAKQEHWLVAMDWLRLTEVGHHLCVLGKADRIKLVPSIIRSLNIRKWVYSKWVYRLACLY
jgi:hypothetical protein